MMRRTSTFALVALVTVFAVWGCSGSTDAEKDTAAVTKTMPKHKPGERIPGLTGTASGSVPGGQASASRGTAPAATD